MQNDAPTSTITCEHGQFSKTIPPDANVRPFTERTGKAHEKSGCLIDEDDMNHRIQSHVDDQVQLHVVMLVNILLGEGRHLISTASHNPLQPGLRPGAGGLNLDGAHVAALGVNMASQDQILKDGLAPSLARSNVVPQSVNLSFDVPVQRVIRDLHALLAFPLRHPTLCFLRICKEALQAWRAKAALLIRHSDKYVRVAAKRLVDVLSFPDHVILRKALLNVSTSFDCDQLETLHTFADLHAMIWWCIENNGGSQPNHLAMTALKEFPLFAHLAKQEVKNNGPAQDLIARYHGRGFDAAIEERKVEMLFEVLFTAWNEGLLTALVLKTGRGRTNILAIPERRLAVMTGLDRKYIRRRLTGEVKMSHADKDKLLEVLFPGNAAAYRIDLQTVPTLHQLCIPEAERSATVAFSGPLVLRSRRNKSKLCTE